ncbi:response regulator [Metabacillus idriensis]|uniref:response regulator n=1 Tax=Metabacillus idriensis TaxID=324768 RepID=UPI002813E5E8|nr:response regulator [Metabacillus idriensis]MDR0139183.1 response regulator [Metabacillus idriensis]
MNVLIVDDDRFVVTALEKKMNWNALGIKKIFTANNIRQAKKLLEKEKIDLLISDIEMPQGSGLELLSWIRLEGYDLQAIFLTNFADFNYAQKAIELQSFEYYLKPIEFDKLELIVKKAIKKLNASQSKEEAVKMMNYRQQNKDTLQKQFWYTYLRDNNFSKRENLLELLEMNQVNYSYEDSFVPFYIALFPYRVKDYHELQMSIQLDADIENSLIELLKTNFNDRFVDLEFLSQYGRNEYEYLACFKLNQGKDSIEWSLYFNDFIMNINNQLNCDVQCFIGNNALLEKLPQVIQELEEKKENIVDFRNKLFIVENCIKNDNKYAEPPLHLLEHYLESEDKLSFVNKCYQYSVELLNQNALDQEILNRIRQDLTQIIYAYLKRKEILANKLFQGKMADLLLSQSLRSIDDFLCYIDYLVEVSISYSKFADSKESVVTTLQNYIDQNYEENLSRNELAKVVYLSPDYIARIFKKETGISLVNYIIRKRVEIAKDLLKNTDLPIHLISSKVGYENYSYFTKLFKKETNYTPVEYRRHILS